MIDKRQFLITIAAAGTTALAGCNGDNNTNNTDDNAQNNSGEFSINQFLVEGEQPQEYEAEFISGLEPEEVADQLTPEIQYQLQGSSNVETEFQLEYTDDTIPQGEPLDETIEGETHNGAGEYTQNTPMPEELAAEVLKNPKNIKTTFKSTDTETGQTEIQEYEINLADSYVEQIQKSHFQESSLPISNAEPINVKVEENTINIKYESNNEIGSEGFNIQMGNIVGLYSSNIDRTNVPYGLELEIEDKNGETYEENVENDRAEKYLNGKMERREFQSDIMYNDLWIDID